MNEIKKGDLYINDNNTTVEIIDIDIDTNDKGIVSISPHASGFVVSSNQKNLVKCQFQNLCAGCGKIIDCSVSLCNDCETKINKDEPSWYRK